jgi:hypothetical protein
LVFTEYVTVDVNGTSMDAKSVVDQNATTIDWE